MNLPYDPSNGEIFWNEISKIPGYPTADEPMPIKMMLFETGAVFKTSDTLLQVGAKKTAPLLLVMDEVKMMRGTENLKELIANDLSAQGWQVTPVILLSDASGQVHTDMPQIEKVKAQLKDECSVLSIGSGVVTDIAKHACYLYQLEKAVKLPFVVIQTANSVSAFTSNMAPVFVDGVKRTLPSRYPDALICDLETLRDAPAEMTQGGVGDLLAAYVSLPDWQLATSLGMDPSHSELPLRLIGPLDQIFLSEADNIRAGTLDSMSILAKAIALGGLAMSLSHATTPMSGYEHVISHVLDMPAEINGSPLVIHGIQVALASVMAVDAYRRFLDEFEPAELNIESCYPAAEKMQAEILKNFAKIDPTGKAGAECWSDYKLKLDAWKMHRKDFEQVLENWSELKSKLEDGIRPVENLVQILRAIGAPLKWDQLNPPIQESEVKFAFFNAPLMRKRLTLGDILIFTNWDREALWSSLWENFNVLTD